MPSNQCWDYVLSDNSMVMHRYVQAFIQDFTAGGGGGGGGGGSDRLKVMLA